MFDVMENPTEERTDYSDTFMTNKVREITMTQWFCYGYFEVRRRREWSENNASIGLRGRPVLTGDGWRLNVVCGYHNHDVVENLEGHVYVGRLNADELSLVNDMTKNMATEHVVKRGCSVYGHTVAMHDLADKVKVDHRMTMRSQPPTQGHALYIVRAPLNMRNSNHAADEFDVNWLHSAAHTANIVHPTRWSIYALAAYAKWFCFRYRDLSFLEVGSVVVVAAATEKGCLMVALPVWRCGMGWMGSYIGTR
ncbi:putative ADP-glucose phosphorylase-like [Sesbania bispinosa]|nr:putative ADP-glucose phosphorylase-like [Sesbania bispinosa]